MILVTQAVSSVMTFTGCLRINFVILYDSISNINHFGPKVRTPDGTTTSLYREFIDR